MPIGAADLASHNSDISKYKSTSSPVLYNNPPHPQVIRPELVRPSQQQQQQTAVPQTIQQPLAAPPIATIVSQHQQQHLAQPVLSHATSVIRISPASANGGCNQFQPFHSAPVIVDPTHLVPLLPPSTSTANLSSDNNISNGATMLQQQQSEGSTVTKNGINTGSVYKWHTLLPVINAPPTPVTDGHHHTNNPQSHDGSSSGPSVMAGN